MVSILQLRSGVPGFRAFKRTELALSSAWGLQGLGSVFPVSEKAGGGEPSPALHMHPLSQTAPLEGLTVPSTWWSPGDQAGSQVCGQPGLTPVGAGNQLGEQRVWTRPGAADGGHGLQVSSRGSLGLGRRQRAQGAAGDPEARGHLPSPEGRANLWGSKRRRAGKQWPTGSL